MASITVRNLDDRLKRRLRIRAAENGRSMEQEVRDILRVVLEEEEAPVRNLVPYPVEDDNHRPSSVIPAKAGIQIGDNSGNYQNHLEPLLGTAIHELFKPFGGVDLELPHREQMREPPQALTATAHACDTTRSTLGETSHEG